MLHKERLPRYVATYVDNRGKRRYRFRKRGCESGHFEHHPASKEGQAEYANFLSGEKPAEATKRITVPGSIDALLALYYESTDYRGNAAAVSLAKRQAVLEAFRAKHGHRLVAGARFEKLDKYIAEIATGWLDDKGRRHGGAFAAETARKQIRGMFKYATKLEWRGDNPMDHVDYRPKKTIGFHSWTEAEIAQYQAHYPLGTKQRLALELMLWTGKRRGDATRLGPQHVVGEDLAGRDAKTGKAWILPIAPQLREAIDSMPKGQHLCFIMSERGRAYSAASFGNQFRRWCDDAGLPNCSAHGLRKAISRRMAEENVGNAGIKSVTLHSRDEEVSLYVAAVDQKRLAKQAISLISARQLSSTLPDARQLGAKND